MGVRLALAFGLLVLLAAALFGLTALLLALEDRAEVLRRPTTNLSVVLFGELLPGREVAGTVSHRAECAAPLRTTLSESPIENSGERRVL